uniref:HMG box protein n=1 Tax=Rhizophagus irregularis TaxID=588596 RepID=S5NGI3_9GLOM|nr:HMG box protein [Rhizophagus irregularis]
MAATTENNNYDEIVKKSNYKFNLPMEELINNSKATRRAKRNKKQVIPRPPNAYMIYRRNKAESPDIKSSGQSSSSKSKLIADMWRNETDKNKQLFFILSMLAEKNCPKDLKYVQKKPSNTSKSSKTSSNFILSKL